MKLGPLEIAAQRRQRILDFLALHPGAKMDKIIAWLRAFGDDGNASNTIRTMVTWGEARYAGLPCARMYFALQAITRSADESKCTRLKNAEQANADRHQQAITRADRAAQAGTGVYIHKPGSLATANARGQGAVRAKVSCNCSQNY